MMMMIDDDDRDEGNMHIIRARDVHDFNLSCLYRSCAVFHRSVLRRSYIILLLLCVGVDV